MRVRIKTASELRLDGFKFDGLTYFKGSDKRKECSRADIVREHVVQQLGGRTVTITHIEDVNDGMLEVRRGQHRYKVPIWLVVESVDFESVVHPEEMVLERHGQPVQFIRGSKTFKFPCSYDRLTTHQARKLAKWVLRVSS